MRRRTYIVAAVLLLVVAVLLAVWLYPNRNRSSIARSEPPAIMQDRESQIPEIYEAVFRHLFQHNVSGAQQNAKGYFLTINGDDPTLEFLKRFEKHKPPVAAGSTFKVLEGGLKFRIDSLKWIDDDTAELQGGYYEGNLSASTNLYRVARKDGRWIVVEDQQQWVS
jgi:hypothetical protein